MRFKVRIKLRLRRLIEANIEVREKLLWRILSLFNLGSRRIGYLGSVCLILGPYRNMTTFLSSILALHPNCQILNHAEERVLSDKKINFLLNYSKEKFYKFCQFVFFASQRGKRGLFGGSITFSDTFKKGFLKQAYRERYENLLLKNKVNCIVWKGDLLVTTYIRKNKIDFADLFKKNAAIKFIRPIRNPLDCAMSNLKTGVWRRVASKSKSDYMLENILERIVDDLAWFAKLKEEYPDNFFYFFEDEFNSDLLFRLLNFLNIAPDDRWIKDSVNAMEIKKTIYEYPKNLIESYERLINLYFGNSPLLLNNLQKFIS